jgi:hypothetical protein
MPYLHPSVGANKTIGTRCNINTGIVIIANIAVCTTMTSRTWLRSCALLPAHHLAPALLSSLGSDLLL